jgi:hypothetical protein
MRAFGTGAARRNILLFAFLISSAVGSASGGCRFQSQPGLQGTGGAGGTEDPGNPPGSGGAMRIPRPDGSLITTGTDAQLSDDTNCGVATVTLTRVPPEILIVLDKSFSMTESAGAGGMGAGGMGGAGGRMGMGRGQNCYQDLNCNSKWEDMTAGLSEVVTATSMTVNWGLKLFGTTDGCGVSANPEVPIAPDNAVAVNAAIVAAEPESSTPTRVAIETGVAYLQTLTTTNRKFLLLATDGQPTCGMGAGGMMGGGNMAPDNQPAIDAVTAAAAAGFPTFVVGIATASNDVANTTLSTMAVQGGQPRAGTPPYYPVTSREELVTALGAITEAAASCTLTLGQPPPDPENVGVRVRGDERVPRDTTHTDGWDYGPGMTSIVLYGSYCGNVMSGTFTDLRALFGCPGVMID